MTPEEASVLLESHSILNAGKVYGDKKGLSLGTGLVYSGVFYPLYDATERLFLTVEGTVYVLTHECDVDPNNDRAFNKTVLVCPLIPVEHFLDDYAAEFADTGALRNFLVEVARCRVSRVFYLPPTVTPLKYGCFLYLNALASTHVSEFGSTNLLVALSQYGLRHIDVAIHNHLLREKTEPLGLALTRH